MEIESIQNPDKLSSNLNKKLDLSSIPTCTSETLGNKGTVFFDANIPISEYKKLSEECDINELFSDWSKVISNYLRWANSTQNNFCEGRFKFSNRLLQYPFPVACPPGFYQKPYNNNLSEGLSKQVNLKRKKIENIIPVTNNKVILKLPSPNLRLLKRMKRGMFEEEIVKKIRYTGTIITYNLNRRFGFIEVDGEKTSVFICEDDLLLSKIQLKKFKRNISKKRMVRLSFFIKEYVENEELKKKAIEIKII